MRRSFTTPGTRTPAGARGRAQRQRRPAPVTTAASAAALGAGALAVGRAARALGVQPLDAAAAEELDRRTDPQAAAVGAVLCRALPGAASVTRGTGVKPAAIEGLLEQRGELVNLHLSARQYLGDASTVRRALGAEVRRILGRLLARTRQEAETDAELRSDAGELLHAADAVTAGRQAEAQRTIDRRRAADAEVAAERDRGEMLRAILALREGEALDDETIERAAAHAAEPAAATTRMTEPAPAPGRSRSRRR